MGEVYGQKAMILTDKVRDTWTFFFQTGMHQVFIVNYESLKSTLYNV